MNELKPLNVYTELDEQVALTIKPKPTVVHEAHWEPIEDFPWQCVPAYDDGDECNWIPLPFSSSICYAWKLVEIAREMGYDIELDSMDAWDCSFYSLWPKPILHGTSDTAPEAIAKAFLELKKETSNEASIPD